jgi:hypothetical protein
MSKTTTTVVSLNCDLLLASLNGAGNLTFVPTLRRLSWANNVTKDGVIPHYRQVIASGGNATTAMSGTETTYDYQPGNGLYVRQSKFVPGENGQLRYAAKGSLCYLGFPSFALDRPTTIANNRALTNYYSNLQSVETKFKGLVFSGELKESLSMIRNPAKALRNSIDHYLSHLKKNGPRVKKPKRPSFVRKTWLEYSFGWRPLISDIDTAISAFYKSDAVRPIFEMVKGSGRDKIVKTNSEEGHTHGALQWTYRYVQLEEVFIQYYGIYRSTGNGVPDSHSYGFSPTEFVPTVWELIPYSFLVDYFTNIGDIVSSWSYRFNNPAWTSRLIRREGEWSTSNEKFVIPPLSSLYTYSVTGHPGRSVVKKKVFTRTPSVALSLPSLELQVPGMTSQWVNLFALSENFKKTRHALGS